MPAQIKGLENLIKQVRKTSDTGVYKVVFYVKEDGLIHDFKMELHNDGPQGRQR